MFGKINLVNFSGIIDMPPEVKTAWHDVFDGAAGVAYKPLLYMADQVVNGVELVENSIKEIL